MTSRPLHVAMVIQKFRPAFAGQGVQVEQLCAELARRGVASSIVTSVRGRPSEAEEGDGYRVYRLRSDLTGLPFTAARTRYWTPLFALRALGFLVSQRRHFDLVHVHTLSDALYASWMFCRAFDLPLVFEMTLVGADDPMTARRQSHFLSGVRWAIYRRCDAYVAISPALAQRYRAAGLPEERLHLIPQGVDTRRFQPAHDRAALRRQLEMPVDEPVIVFVGSLIRRKGIDVLLEAWPRVLEELPAARLLLVGKDRFEDDPEEQRFLDRCLAALPAAARRRLTRLGERPDVERWLTASDVFVFPSRQEGFGSAIIEAMACGLPCVVTRLPGITDFIFAGDGSDGIVAPQDDPERLAAETLRVLRQPSRARAVGAAAQRRAVDGFAMQRVAAAYLELYDRLLHRRERP